MGVKKTIDLCCPTNQHTLHIQKVSYLANLAYMPAELIAVAVKKKHVQRLCIHITVSLRKAHFQDYMETR